MINKTINEKNAAYWNGITLSPILDVLRTPLKGLESFKSEFKELELDLSGMVPHAFARTPEGQRIDFSVLEWNNHDSEALDNLSGHIEWLKENFRDVKYQIGYTIDFGRGKPQAKYVRVEYGDTVEERTF
jgi:hypothetical protein